MDLVTKVIRARIINQSLRRDRVRLAVVVTGDNWLLANRENNDERVFHRRISLSTENEIQRSGCSSLSTLAITMLIAYERARDNAG